MVQRRTVTNTTMAAVMGAVAALCLAPPASAQDFPSGPVELVVPFPPGGGTDASARIFAPFLEEALGVPVNVVNIGGGGGWTAWAQYPSWDPEADDHKLGIVNVPHLFGYLDPSMGRSETYRDFNFIGGLTMDPCQFVVRQDDDRFNTFQDLVDYVRENPDEVVISTTAIGSDNHQSIERTKQVIDGFDVTQIYANSDAEKMQALLGGHADVIAANTAYYVPYVLDAQIRPLVTLHTERSRYLPSVPTFTELTGEDNICFSGRLLHVAPGLDAEKVQILSDAVNEALESPEMALRVMNAYNTIWHIDQEAAQSFLEQLEEQVKSIAYWEEAGN